MDLKHTSAVPRIAVLIPTFDGYFRLAALTKKWIDERWNHHPPIYFCGIGPVSGFTCLPLKRDPRDWVGIAADAIFELARQHFDFVYLLLDDHPPVAPCNADYLNVRLPQLATQLQAFYVSLIAWDQFRSVCGKKLGADHDFWMQNDPNDRWNLSLHPALWQISALLQILQSVDQKAVGPVSARHFEAQARTFVATLQEAFRGDSYRVCGDRYAAGEHWFQKTAMREVLSLCIHAIRFSLIKTNHSQMLQKLDRRLQGYTHYINGPYPMFWSGLMMKGAVHGDALAFLKLTGQRKAERELRWALD